MLSRRARMPPLMEAILTFFRRLRYSSRCLVASASSSVVSDVSWLMAAPQQCWQKRTPAGLALWQTGHITHNLFSVAELIGMLLPLTEGVCRAGWLASSLACLTYVETVSPVSPFCNLNLSGRASRVTIFNIGKASQT